MSQLNSATITFYTPLDTDGKKEITKISVFVYDVNRNLVARNIHFGNDRPFPDDGSFSPVYVLDICNHINKTDFLHGSFDVVIAPIGGDTWVFIPYLLLTFSDGSTINCNSYGNRVVSEYATETTLVF